MSNRHISYWLVIAVLFGVYAIMQITIDPITWDSAVAVILFLLAVSIPSLQAIQKSYRKRTLFIPKYQPSQETTHDKHEVGATNEIQRMQISLFMKLETNVEFVAVLFEGRGTLPVIKGLDDWQWGHGRVPEYVNQYELPNDPEGRWYWEYRTPRHRLKKARLTIGIDFLATDYFDGYLVTRLTCVDGHKEQRLPFKVRKRAEK